MKTQIALILSASLLGLSSLAYSDDDIRLDEAVKLAEAGTIKSFEELDAAVLELHPGATIDDTELELERNVTCIRSNCASARQKNGTSSSMRPPARCCRTTATIERMKPCLA